MTALPASASKSRHVCRPRLTGAVMIALALLALPLVSGCSKGGDVQKAAADPSDTLVARVNGVEIHESDLAMAAQDIGQDLQRMPPDQQREQLIGYLTAIILVTQQPDAKKAADDPDFQRHLAFLRNKMLMGAQLQTQAKSAVTPEAEQQFYDEATQRMAGQDEVHARHILVATEDEAKAIIDQLKNGADFATLAKEKSKDPGSAEEGGDLGYITKDEQMVPEFLDVVFKMSPGQLSNPVKTQFGWHIIKVEDRRPRALPPLASIKDQIDSVLVRRAQSEYIAKLQQTAKIERLDHPATPPGMSFPSLQKEAPPAAAPAPGQAEKK
jgi:peptidyl-prolyl cis-trans isomerase C